MVDAEAGLRWKNLELVADLFNVADVAYREGQFAVQSRLPGEATRPTQPRPQGVTFTPGLPRTLMVHAARTGEDRDDARAQEWLIRCGA